MINTQKLFQRLRKCLFLFALLFPALDYATEPLEEPASATNSTSMERIAEFTAGDIEPPLGALHILSGQEADSVTTVFTRIQRSTEKLAPEGHMESKSNSTIAEASTTEEREISFSSGSFTPSTGLDPSMASEVLAMEVNGRDSVYGFILLDEHLSGFCRKVRFWGKIQKSGVRNSMTYRLLNSRKSNFATEPKKLAGPR